MYLHFLETLFGKCKVSRISYWFLHNQQTLYIYNLYCVIETIIILKYIIEIIQHLCCHWNCSILKYIHYLSAYIVCRRNFQALYHFLEVVRHGLVLSKFLALCVFLIILHFFFTLNYLALYNIFFFFFGYIYFGHYIWHYIISFFLYGYILCPLNCKAFYYDLGQKSSVNVFSLQNYSTMSIGFGITVSGTVFFHRNYSAVCNSSQIVRLLLSLRNYLAYFYL